MKINLWRAVHDWLPTGFQLRKRHIKALDGCFFCGRDDQVEHIFIQCHFAVAVWQDVKEKYGMKLCRRELGNMRQFFLNASHKTVRSSIDRAGKNYKIITLKGHNQEKRKNIPPPHTESTNIHDQEEASTGPAAAKRDRPPLNQQKNTDEIALQLGGAKTTSSRRKTTSPSSSPFSGRGAK
jgi:hypothetical protein